VCEGKGWSVIVGLELCGYEGETQSAFLPAYGYLATVWNIFQKQVLEADKEKQEDTELSQEKTCGERHARRSVLRCYDTVKVSGDLDQVVLALWSQDLNLSFHGAIECLRACQS